MKAAAALPVPSRVLRIGLTNGRSSQSDVAARAFAQAVAQRTTGRIRVDVYFGGALGGEKELAEEVAGGSLDFTLVSSVGYAAPSFAPSLGVFDVPFLFRDVRHARSALDGPIGEAKLKAITTTGAIGLAWSENGVRQLTTVDTAVRTPSDLAGIKIRVPQSEVLIATFQALGAQPAPLPFPDLYAALADGTFQAQENPLTNIRNSNFDKVQKYLCLTGHIYSATMLMANADMLRSLPSEDREAVTLAAKEAAPASRRVNDSQQDSDVKELQSRGMTVISDVDRQAFVSAVAKAEPKFEALFGRDTLSTIRNIGI